MFTTEGKLPPGALLAIADDLLADVYTNWLRLDDLCRLDSAVCAKWLRHHFLRLISTKYLRFLREEIDVTAVSKRTHEALRSNSLNWIIKRGIHLASLRLPWSSDCYISGCEQTSIRAAVASLVEFGLVDKLETIDIFLNLYLKDDDIAAIIEKSFTSLRIVDIHRCNALVSTASLLKRCTGLEEYTAIGNESAVQLTDIFTSCIRIKKMVLRGLYGNLTNEMVLSMADNCQLIQHMDLDSCFRVSDEAVMGVARACPLLVFVNLSMMTDLTDKSVVSLFMGCPLLKFVDISFCIKLTDDVVLSAATYLPGLAHLDVRNCSFITREGLTVVRNSCANIVIEMDSDRYIQSLTNSYYRQCLF